jgi:hypothetical protein
MVTRTEQAHERRVQKIVEQAASEIAADAPIEEEVVVTVEELPPGQGTAAPSGGATAGTAAELTDTVVTSAAYGQQIAADGIKAWTDFTRTVLETTPMLPVLDPRAMVDNTFRFAGELLAAQKDFALRVADLLPTANCAGSAMGSGQRRSRV